LENYTGEITFGRLHLGNYMWKLQLGKYICKLHLGNYIWEITFGKIQLEKLNLRKLVLIRFK